MHEVGISRGYAIWYWVVWAAIVVLTLGIGVLFLPVAFIVKARIADRNRILFEEGSNHLVVRRGRIFAFDDDVVPLRSVDNVKIDRSVLGSLFGWCAIDMSTRVERYKLHGVDTQDALALREALLEVI